jgi:2-haloalkanoic acid dehalogenase type II
MPERPLSGIKACVFDAYGTLFDFASAARDCPDVPGEVAERLTALWRDKQVQYTWLRAAQGRHADFRQVTADALDFALETLGLEQPGLRSRLLDLYLRLAAFAEVPEVLARVRAAGLKTAILSNGTPAMLASAVAAARLDGCFDAVLSVEEVGAFKPDRRNSRSTGSAFPPRPLPSYLRTAGTPTRHRRSACGWCGATATANGASGCPARRIARSPRSWNCRRWSGRERGRRLSRNH